MKKSLDEIKSILDIVEGKKMWSRTEIGKFLRDQIVNFLGFASPMISVTATELCCFYIKAALDNV